MQDLSGEALLFAQESEQQMFRPDVFVRKPFRFFGGLGQHALTFIAEGKINRGRNFFADGGVSLDLFADRFHRRVRAQETVRQGFIFS